jgi:transposase
MRVNTAFNRILRLVGATVRQVEFTGDGVVVTVRPRARIHRCPCGRRAAGYDHGTRVSLIGARR